MPVKAPGFMRLALEVGTGSLRPQPDVWAEACTIHQRTRMNGKMLSKTLNVLMLISATVLLASAFLPVQRPNAPRSLMLLGSGLVMLAGATRRYYADEK